jgi:cytidylate kinase
VTISKPKTCPKNPNKKIIAIDGPAGTGKSTVSELLAQNLGYLYLDTGAMYRALTLAAINARVNFLDSSAITRVGRRTKIDLKQSNNGSLNVFLNNRLVNDEIRSPKISSLVSFVAKIAEVRKIMVKLQRQIGKRQNCVVEGRDIGTVVFPDALVKFYLDASLDVRADRRFKELKLKGIRVALSEIKELIRRRDRSDVTRRVGPLKKALDAIRVDTSNLNIAQVVNRLLREVEKKSHG